MAVIHSIAKQARPDEASLFRQKMLAWYDRHRRVLPWRAGAGETPDPYKVWLSEIMLQQTTVAAVIPYFNKFMEKWPTVEDLANAPVEEVMQKWAGLGYYARARNLHACAHVIAKEYNGQFPSKIEDLRKLPGIGEYTSAAIASIAFDEPSVVVDGNVERVMARYHACTIPLPEAKKTLKKLAADYAENQTARPGDYAQALMDLGATICTPKSPLCALCPLNQSCTGCQKGIAATLPAKTVKKPRPQRIGHAYWITNEKGEVLLHRRPEKGLLGGMIALPTTEWLATQPEALLKTSKHYGFITHTFTHFDLKLECYNGPLSKNTFSSDDYFWASEEKLKSLAFPTVFQKAVTLFKKKS